MAGVANIALPTPTCRSILQGFHRGGDQRIAAGKEARVESSGFFLARSRPRRACGTVDPRLATITVQQLINHRAGWVSRAANFDPVFKMRAIARRLGVRAGGAMAGTSSVAIARPDGLDLCFVVSTRNFGGAKAMGEASNDINRASTRRGIL
jgi:hypothetical protein